jgi:NTP pyrophosphatase (non-canonical NTP hydrolase)
MKIPALIRDYQDEHREWVAHNFPDQKSYEPLLGLVEEVGELSHAHLKFEQGIRGMDDMNVMLAKIDAVGDIFIYLMSYCNANYIDLEVAIEDTWTRVKNRDWQADPEKGGE